MLLTYRYIIQFINLLRFLVFDIVVRSLMVMRLVVVESGGRGRRHIVVGTRRRLRSLVRGGGGLRGRGPGGRRGGVRRGGGLRGGGLGGGRGSVDGRRRGGRYTHTQTCIGWRHGLNSVAYIFKRGIRILKDLFYSLLNSKYVPKQQLKTNLVYTM